MSDLVEQGVSIIMISSELPELLNMSDRIIVMREGSITGELTKEEASEDRGYDICNEGDVIFMENAKIKM